MKDHIFELRRNERYEDMIDHEPTTSAIQVQRYRRGHGFETHFGLNSFQA